MQLEVFLRKQTEMCNLLVYTHIVCERLSAIQEPARLPEFLAHFGQNTLFCLGKTPQIGTSHGGLRKFEFEAAEFLVGPEYPPPRIETLVRT